MKNRILLAVFVLSILGACKSTKVVAMQPSDPVVPQMPSPPKTENPDRIAQGKSLYEQNCAKCHKLFSPSEFTKQQWGPILTSMQPNAGLSNEEITLVSEYVYSLAAQ